MGGAAGAGIGRRPTQSAGAARKRRLLHYQRRHARPDINLAALATQHVRSGALVTMAVIRNRWPDRYGGVVTDSRGTVYGFVPRGSPAAKYLFVGVQMARPTILPGLPADVPAKASRRCIER